MTNTYRALSVLAKSEHGDGVVELELSVMEERDALDGGHLELVPRPYRVMSNNFSAAPEGAEYKAAFRKENEAALIQGGHIVRVDPPQGGPVKGGKQAAERDEPEVLVPSKADAPKK